MKPQRNIILVVIIVVVFLLVVIQYRQPNQSITPSQTVTVGQTLQDLQTALHTDASPSATGDWDWIQANGTHLPLTGKSIGLSTKAQNGLGTYGDVTGDDPAKITKQFITDLSSTMQTFFLNHGFSKGTANNSNGFTEMGTVREGYSNGDIKCITSLTAQSIPFGYVTCGTVDQRQLALQKDFSSLIQQTKTESLSYTFRVQKVEGNFALGYVGDIAGYQWIAKKTNGTWAIIAKTPDLFPCVAMQKYSVPKTLYGNCYTP